MPTLTETPGSHNPPPRKRRPTAFAAAPASRSRLERPMAIHPKAGEVGPSSLLAPVRLLRMTEVVWMTGFQKSYIYLRLRDKSFPPQIHVGTRVRFIHAEVVAVQHAWIQRKTRDEIRQLIACLVAAR